MAPVSSSSACVQGPPTLDAPPPPLQLPHQLATTQGTPRQSSCFHARCPHPATSSLGAAPESHSSLHPSTWHWAQPLGRWGLTRTALLRPCLASGLCWDSARTQPFPAFHSPPPPTPLPTRPLLSHHLPILSPRPKHPVHSQLESHSLANVPDPSSRKSSLFLLSVLCLQIMPPSLPFSSFLLRSVRLNHMKWQICHCS